MRQPNALKRQTHEVTLVHLAGNRRLAVLAPSRPKAIGEIRGETMTLHWSFYSKPEETIRTRRSGMRLVPSGSGQSCSQQTK